MQTLRPLTQAVAVAVLCSSTLIHADSGSIVRDSVRITTYDGVTDDLLSAGLNLAGLVAPCRRLRRSEQPDAGGAAPPRDLRQLPRHRRYGAGRRHGSAVGPGIARARRRFAGAVPV